MSQKDVTIRVKEADGSIREICAPTDMSLSLMELLKGEGYPIEATCGGMALCATCHIEVLEGIEKLHPKEDAELDMLDTLPEILDGSRLACQIKIHEETDGILLRLAPHL